DQTASTLMTNPSGISQLSPASYEPSRESWQQAVAAESSAVLSSTVAHHWRAAGPSHHLSGVDHSLKLVSICPIPSNVEKPTDWWDAQATRAVNWSVQAGLVNMSLWRADRAACAFMPDARLAETLRRLLMSRGCSVWYEALLRHDSETGGRSSIDEASRTAALPRKRRNSTPERYWC
uniref:RNase H domain-containing protein n=1 Tax=Macrostomum lignano TaxID=282301 RepID=A0A1I8FQ46_9PLAT